MMDTTITKECIYHLFKKVQAGDASALNELTDLAEQGHAIAQNNLGCMY